MSLTPEHAIKFEALRAAWNSLPVTAESDQIIVLAEVVEAEIRSAIEAGGLE